jgi:SAM-dependent methyltransferase
MEAIARPVEEASPVDSGDVIAVDDMEEISSEAAPPSTEEVASPEAPKKKKRAETAEPPPPPPPSQKAAAPKAAPKSSKKPAKDEGKRRQKKPWFEELFDEDYLRTLPFLTPQATQFEAKFVMESLGVDAGAQILDVGCGYGRHAMELAARGYHLVGLDSSLPLLLRGADEAQRRGLTINFVHGDMRDMTYESQFDGAYCLFSSFGYFDDETNKRTAQNIAKALKPGARFVVEVLNRDYLVADLPSRVWWEGDGCVVLEEVEFNYFSSRIVSNRSVVFDDGRQLEHEISLRSFSLHELGKFLHAVGFRVLEISGSMSTRGRFFGAHSRDIVVVAERRATKADES